MQHDFTRRDFLSRTALAATAAAFAPAALAIEPFKRTGPPRLLLGLAAYSFRQYFKEGKGTDAKTDPAKRIGYAPIHQLLRRAQCAAEVTSYYFPAQLTDDFLLQLKRHAFLRGVELSGTAVGNVSRIHRDPSATRKSPP